MKDETHSNQALGEKDDAEAFSTARKVIEEYPNSYSFIHMTFKTSEPDFYQKARENSIRSMTDASYDYMRGNDFWEVSKCILLQEI